MPTANLALTLPVPTLAVIALESNISPNPSGSVAMTLPLARIALSGGQGIVADMSGLALPIPLPTLPGQTPVAASMSMILPAPSLGMAGIVAEPAALAMTLPMPRLMLAGPNSMLLALP